MLAFVELFALTGLAVAQPAFDVLSDNAALFVARRTTPLQLVGLALVFVLGPALVLWCTEVLIGLVRPRLRRWVHAALAAAVVAVIAAEVLRHQSSLGVTPILALAVLVGIGGGVLILRVGPVRTWLHYLAIAPVIFAGLFLFASPVTDAVLRGGPPAADVTVGAPHRVVMIVFDELPTESLLDGTGHIDSSLFPHFAAFAADSTWYRNDTTVSPFTETAVPSILSGDYPADEDVVPVASEYPNNLFTLLGGSYEMNVFESPTHLCPLDICGNTAHGSTANRSGFRGLLSASVSLWRDFAEPARSTTPPAFSVSGHPRELDIGAEFVRSLRAGSAPRLDFLHVLLPHEPWHYGASGQNYFASGLPGLGIFAEWMDEGAALSGRQRHLLQLQATDALLGRVIARLEQIHAYDDALVVVTADHGVAFAASPIRGVSAENYPEIAWTPLMVKAPGQASGKIDDRAALGIDVLPTIAQQLEVKLPAPVDGHSLLGPARSGARRRMLSWSANVLKPPPGRQYFTVDGTRGFSAVMSASASNAAGDPSLRLFRLGAYARLVGLDPRPMVDGAGAPGRGWSRRSGAVRAHRSEPPRGAVAVPEGPARGSGHPVALGGGLGQRQDCRRRPEHPNPAAPGQLRLLPVPRAPDVPSWAQPDRPVRHRRQRVRPHAHARRAPRAGVRSARPAITARPRVRETVGGRRDARAARTPRRPKPQRGRSSAG